MTVPIKRPRFASLLEDRTAASAVEFALVMPIFLLVLFGIIVYGSYLAMVHGLQQLTAEAARASIGGLSDSERLSLATSDIDSNVGTYPLLAPDRRTIVSALATLAARSSLQANCVAATVTCAMTNRSVEPC